QSNIRPGREGWSSAIGDEDEEAYFNTSDEEDNISSTSGECSKIGTTKQDVESKEELTSEDESKVPVESKDDSKDESKDESKDDSKDDSTKDESKDGVGSVGLVDYPDEDDDENVKKDIDELVTPDKQDKQQTSTSPPLSPRPTQPIIGKRSRPDDDDDDDDLLIQCPLVKWVLTQERWIEDPAIVSDVKTENEEGTHRIISFYWVGNSESLLGV
ncbi:3524_t:CDS:2, partial [Racocetra fulgida]